MAIVTYTPGFQHEDWVDNVDRVQAGGVNGFNVRFNTIEAEFQKIGDTMTAEWLEKAGASGKAVIDAYKAQ